MAGSGRRGNLRAAIRRAPGCGRTESDPATLNPMTADDQAGAPDDQTGALDAPASAPDQVAERLRAVTEALESVSRDRGLLRALTVEERTRLLNAAGDVFNPDLVQRRLWGKAIRRQEKAAKQERDESALAETGIRVLRDRPVYTTPNAALPAGFEQARLVEMRDRRVGHRALERDLIINASRILLDRATILVDRGIPVARARSALAAAVRAAGGAPGGEHGQHEERDEVDGLSLSHCPDNRIVWRPRPSRYASSAESAPTRITL